MMQEFFQFVWQNWALWSLFIVLIIIIIWFETRSVVGGVTKIGSQELVHLINRKQAIVLDIREEKTFKTGHIVGAISWKGKKANQTNAPDKKMGKLKQKTVALVCANGQNSLKTAQQLKKDGFEKLYVLKGGMDAWLRAGLPIQKG